MMRITNLLTTIIIVFFTINSFFPVWGFINNLLLIILAVVLAVYLILNRKIIKVDYLDILFFIVPVIYLGIYIFDRKLVTDSYLYKLFQDFLIMFIIIALRRWINKENIKMILQIIVYISTINFILSIIFLIMPKIMNLVHIYAYFGDTFLNSIDRFYGLFLYPNASALMFLISNIFLINAVNNEEGNKNINLILLFINIIGLTFTYSKMQTISALMIICFVIIYNFVKKDFKFNSFLFNVLVSVLLPVIYMQFAYRSYLITINLGNFILKLCFSCIMFLFLFYLFNKVVDKKKYVLWIVYGFIGIFLIYNFIFPKANSLVIQNVKKDNDVIITDFFLEKDKEYKLKLNLDIKEISPYTKIQIERLYTDEYDIPHYDVVQELDLKNEIIIDLIAKDNEYYNLKLINLDEKTKIKLNSFSVNDNEIKLNTLFLPYQWLHQKDLVKYDKESVASRFTFYKDSLMMLKENGFVIGHGYGTFKYYREFYDLKYRVEEPHSFIFDLWLNTGLYGIIFIGILIIKSLINVLKNIKNSQYLLYFMILFAILFVVPFDLIYSIMILRVILYLMLVFIIDFKE